MDNYAEDNVQAPYIIRRNYEKYLKDYEEFYNGGFGPTMPGEYISEKLYGAPIGKVLQNAVVSVSSKTQTFQYEPSMIDDQKIKTEVNNLIEGIDWKKICFEIRQGESRNRSLVAHRKNIFFNRLDLDHPLRYLSPFGTFASTYINKSEDLSPLVFINEVHQQWASLSSEEKNYYHSISSQKRQEYISNKLVYDKCLNLFQEKYISFFEVCENQNVSIKKRKLELISNDAGDSAMQTDASASPKHANSSSLGDRGKESKDKYIQPSRDDREKTERNPDQKDQTKDHKNVDSTLISESSIQLQKQSSEIGNQPIIEAAKREYAVRYVNTESIPTCTTSVLNIQTWTTILSSFIIESNKASRGYASDEESEDEDEHGSDSVSRGRNTEIASKNEEEIYAKRQKFERITIFKRNAQHEQNIRIKCRTITKRKQSPLVKKN